MSKLPPLIPLVVVDVASPLLLPMPAAVPVLPVWKFCHDQFAPLLTVGQLQLASSGHSRFQQGAVLRHAIGVVAQIAAAGELGDLVQH
ncbi:hypothetical protein Xgly_11515 [Xanthomonas citri pv. glycines]|uniref:Secreted protein n=1 Tax=Xanthomonas campestris pv. glycines TaxID=473421 RepID=A0AAX0I2Z0_XANCG|nr:hypothetical protein BIY41_10630 [Xanthomonas citri pv. glycines]OOX03885.1 hypothetical protein Xgly_11515 [Xanthomonas citri pv. glycines]